MTITDFGITDAGANAKRISISAGDLTVAFLDFGAILQSVRLAGVDHDLTLGSDRMEDYLGPLHYHGALVGPVVNRLAGGTAPLDGRVLEFERNQNGLHLLHSGQFGTWRKLWTIAEARADSVTFALDLPDGEGGFPGNRRVTARFTVLPPSILRMDIAGTTDAPTLMNFANHSYWNLDGTADWTGHRLRIAADRYLPTTDSAAPTGEIRAVDGSGYDLRAGPVLRKGDPPIDHNFCLSDGPRPLREVLWLSGASGVTMTVATTEAGVQIYDGRSAYDGIAIEPQGWPDAPNHPGFPPVRLAPGETYRQTTEWRFSKG